jgi:hypothetical protein
LVIKHASGSEREQHILNRLCWLESFWLDETVQAAADLVNNLKEQKPLRNVLEMDSPVVVDLTGAAVEPHMISLLFGIAIRIYLAIRVSRDAESKLIVMEDADQVNRSCCMAH